MHPAVTPNPTAKQLNTNNSVNMHYLRTSHIYSSGREIIIQFPFSSEVVRMLCHPGRLDRVLKPCKLTRGAEHADMLSKRRSRMI